jgi:hypothetical protein
MEELVLSRDHQLCWFRRGDWEQEPLRKGFIAMIYEFQFGFGFECGRYAMVYYSSPSKSERACREVSETFRVTCRLPLLEFLLRDIH